MRRREIRMQKVSSLPEIRYEYIENSELKLYDFWPVFGAQAHKLEHPERKCAYANGLAMYLHRVVGRNN